MVPSLKWNDWEFLAHGSANAVFRYIGSRNHEFDGMVIRVRLAGMPIDTKQTYNYLTSDRFNALRDYIPEVKLIACDIEFLIGLGNRLTQIHLKLDERYVLLMPNVFRYPPTDYRSIKLNKHTIFHIYGQSLDTILEFKPKWLYRPTDGILTCRNCVHEKKKGQTFVNCSLLLIDGPEGLKEWCMNIQSELNRQSYQLDVFERLYKLLSTNAGLFQNLYQLQNRQGFNIHNKLVSLNSESDVDPFLQMSMTLKDASIFASLSTGHINILDLDLKPTSKWIKWHNDELRLQKYYYTRSTSCLLSKFKSEQ